MRQRAITSARHRASTIKAFPLLYISTIIPNWQDRELWLASKPLIAPLNNQCCSPVWCLLWCITVWAWVCVCVCVVNERRESEQSSAYAKKHMCINCLSPHRLFQPYCLKMNLVSHYTSLWSLPFDVALCSTILWTGQFTLALKIGCFFKDTSPCD